jgi:hypothetical protein
MNITKILVELRAEMAAIDEAVVVLERLLGGRSLKAAKGSTTGSKRRPFSAETKKRMALAQKKRWAKFRKTKKAAPKS